MNEASGFRNRRQISLSTTITALGAHDHDEEFCAAQADAHKLV